MIFPNFINNQSSAEPRRNHLGHTMAPSSTEIVTNTYESLLRCLYVEHTKAT